MFPSEARRLRCVQRWLHAPTHDEALDAIIDLARVLRDERQPAGGTGQTDREPQWDDEPEARHG